MLKKELETLLKEVVKELKDVHQAIIRNLQTAATAGDIALGLTHLFIRKEPICRLLSIVANQVNWKKL